METSTSQDKPTKHETTLQFMCGGGLLDKIQLKAGREFEGNVSMCLRSIVTDHFLRFPKSGRE